MTYQTNNLKQFDKEYSSFFQPEHKFKLDPYLYTTQAVDNQIQQFYSIQIASSMYSATIAAILTAPFQTIVTSLQLSVKPHKNIYDKQAYQENQNLGSNTKQLKKINTQLTIQEKRKMELQIRSGQKQPYTAPVYTGYMETIRGLMKQGWKAFFKGTGFRVSHTLFHIYPLLYINDLIRKQNTLINPLAPLALLGQTFLAKLIVDFTINPFYIGQNRSILQNNIKQFRSYKSGLAMMRKVGNNGQMWNGASYHIFNNITDVFFRLPLLTGISPSLYNNSDFQSILTFMAVPYYVGQILMYPFNTAFRRVTCQCKEMPGMIPLRYSSVWHAFKVIFFEEGLKGLYRGFTLYHLIILMRVGILSTVQLHDRLEQEVL